MSATRSTSGFSLVEVLCAILILGVGVAGLTHGITTALSASKESELQTAAALVAAGQIELLRADGFLINGVEEGECGEGLSLYRWRQTISSTDIEGLHEVEVVIEHTKSDQIIYELKTALFDPPLLSALDSSGGRDRKDSRRREQRGR